MARPAPPPHHSSAVRFSAKEPGIVSAQPSWLIVTGAAPVADLGSGAGLAHRPGDDLAAHRIGDVAQPDDLRPGMPRIAERGIERIGPRQEAMDLVEHEALRLEGRRPPADVEPHEAERPVEQRLRVDRVGPPGRDVDRDAGVGDGSLEPGVVARPERGRDRAVEREPHAVGRSDLDRGRAGHPCRACLDERPSEPAEVGALGGGPIGEGRRRGVVWHVGTVRVDAAPRDRLVDLHPFQDPADEPVVARDRAPRCRLLP